MYAVKTDDLYRQIGMVSQPGRQAIRGTLKDMFLLNEAD
jgi:hypothetical protein